MTHPPISGTNLVEHLDGLRRLARSLVRSDADADDLTQETARRALESQGPPPRDAGRWLRGVLRNVARSRYRADARQRAREAARARRDDVATPHDVAVGIEIRRQIVEAVGRLRAPYQEAIVLRYFEALPPRAIAQRLAVSVPAVKQRLRRGLVQLRAQLDQGDGGREKWLAALAPLVATRLGVTSWAWQMGKVAGLLVAVGLLTWLLAASEAPDDVPPAARVAGADGRAAREGAPTLTGRRAKAPGDAAAPKPVQRAIAGRVVDLAGRPVPDLELLAVPTRAGSRTRFGTTSMADGAFRFGEVDDERYELGVQDENWRVVASVTGRPGDGDLTLRVVPPGSVSLRIVDDETGAVVKQGRCWIDLRVPATPHQAGVGRGWSMPIDPPPRVTWKFEPRPRGTDAQVEVQVRALGYVPWIQELTVTRAEPRIDVDVRLLRPKNAAQIPITLDFAATAWTPRLHFDLEVRAASDAKLLARRRNFTVGPSGQRKILVGADDVDVKVHVVDTLGVSVAWTQRVDPSTTPTLAVAFPEFAVLRVTRPHAGRRLESPSRVRVRRAEEDHARHVRARDYAIPVGTLDLSVVPAYRSPGPERRRRQVTVRPGDIVEFEMPD